MKLAVKIVAPLVALLAAATAAVAVAEPAKPATPYPVVKPVDGVCKSKTTDVLIQQALYDQARTDYDRDKRLVPNSVSEEDFRKTEKVLAEATLALNAAKFAEATCFNEAGNDPKKVCIGLALERRRLMAELPLREELARIAALDAAAAERLLRIKAISEKEAGKIITAAKVAQLLARKTKELIEEIEKKIADTKECKDFPLDPEDDEEEELPTSTVSTPVEPTSTGVPSPTVTAPTSVVSSR